MAVRAAAQTAVKVAPVVLAARGATVVMAMAAGAAMATAVMGAAQTAGMVRPAPMVLMGLMVPRVTVIPVPVR